MKVCINAKQVILPTIISIAFFLLGIKMLSYISEGVVESILSIIVLDTVIVFFIKTTRIEEYTGKICSKAVLLCTVIALFNVFFGEYVVYKDFINGHSNVISNHYEHNLMFTQMSQVAKNVQNGISFFSAGDGIHFDQYYHIFMYCSVLFIFGGINVTLMSVWGTLHLFFVAAYAVMIAKRMHVNGFEKYNFIFWVALLQPLFMATNTFNKVVIGESIVMLALYIYASSYEKPVKCCCLFPIYAFLLWIVRLQYIVVAIAICLCSAFFSHSEDTKRDNVGRIMAIGVIIICCLFAFTKIDLSSYISQDLNFDVYMGNTSYDILSLFKRFIISFLPYFPVTHLFDDPHWSYGLAGALQIPINLSLIAILVSDLYRNRRLVEIIKNPLIISIMIFYMSGFLSAVHVTYISVGMPLMAIVYQDYEKSKYRKYIFAFFILYVVSSLIYEILGLRGSGMLFFG